MSDDLVKRLRAMLEGDMRPSPLGKRAADRIEELEADLAYWQKDSADAWDKCEENRVKLAKAVDALGRLVYLQSGGPCTGIQSEQWLSEARTALAELTSSVAADNQVKGGKHD